MPPAQARIQSGMNLVEGLMAVVGPIVAGGVGGWISTFFTNRAANKRQQSDHAHARRLAKDRIAVDAAGALRTQRVELYLELMEVSTRLQNDLQWLAYACATQRAPVDDKRAARLESATKNFTTTRDDLLALRPRILLIAGPDVREACLVMSNLVDAELPQTDLNAMTYGGWSYDDEGEERRAVTQWWQDNRTRLEILSHGLHEAMRNDVQQAPS